MHFATLCTYKIQLQSALKRIESGLFWVCERSMGLLPFQSIWDLLSLLHVWGLSYYCRRAGGLQLCRCVSASFFLGGVQGSIKGGAEKDTLSLEAC